MVTAFGGGQGAKAGGAGARKHYRNSKGAQEAEQTSAFQHCSNSTSGGIQGHHKTSVNQNLLSLLLYIMSYITCFGLQMEKKNEFIV